MSEFGRHNIVKYIIGLLFCCPFLSKKTHTRKRVSNFWNRNFHLHRSEHFISIGNSIVTMCTSQEETLGKGVPSIAQSIISKCSRTWSQERRISVLDRTLNPHISVWDCVPEHTVDTQLKDTVYEVRFWLNASFADPALSSNISPNNAIISWITQLPPQQSCEAFAD